MTLGTDYVRLALETAATAAHAEREAIVAAASVIGEAIGAQKTWWVFGTGHSHMLAEEVWGRAGGVTAVRPILEPSLMLHEGLEKSSAFERLAGLAEAIMEVHPVASGDVLLIISNSGRNTVPVEMASLARERGATVIALTSRAHTESVESRAPSRQKLIDLAHVVIDNHGVPGDAIVQRSGNNVGPTSTVVGALLLQALVCEVVDMLDTKGVALDVFRSLNS